MIPNDPYSWSVVTLLTFFGLLGLARPHWFYRLTDFPFVLRRRGRPTDGPTLSHARRWGAISLLGAVLITILIYL